MKSPMLFAAAATLAFAAGCSTSTVPARVATPTAAAPVAAADPASPCRLTGRPEVVVSRAYAPAGVEAVVHDDAFEVRFATAESRCYAVERTSARGAAVRGPCPLFRASEDTRVSTDFGESARKAPDPARAAFGDVVDEPVRAPLGGSIVGDAVGLVPLGGERFLLLGVEAGYTQGERANRVLRGQPIASWGEPVGSPVRLSPPEANVLGTVSVATRPSGEGVVAYLASVGDEIDVFAASFACAMK